jgi:hypothetical protein
MALQYALLKAFRLKNSRLGYYSGRTFISIGGTPSGAGQTRHVLIASLSIADRLNEAPNTLTCSVIGSAAPVEGQAIRVTLGSVNNGRALFAGTLLKVTQVYLADNPKNVAWNLEATDWTWGLQGVLVTYRYRGLSASNVAWDLVTRFAPAGYSTAGIADGLPLIDEITFTNTPLMDALAQTANRIGGYTYCDYDQVIQFFTTYPGQNPADLTITNRSFRDVTFARDLTDVVTRVFSEGGGVNTLMPVAPGESVIPVESTAWYNSAGGVVTSGPQRINYTGTIAGGNGSIVGTGITPSSAPGLALAPGAGVENGNHSYAYTFVTATGETKPSPVGAVTVAAVADPTVGGFIAQVPPNGLPGQGSFIQIGDTISVCYAWSTAAVGSGDYTKTTLPSLPSPSLVTVSNNDPLNPNQSAPVSFSAQHSADPRVTQIFVYLQSSKTGAGMRLLRQTANDPKYAGQWVTFSTQGASAPGSSSAAPNATNATGGQNQVTVSGIAAGPTGTTGRRVYRTAANQSQLKLLTLVADNVTTTYLDAKADATLGANVPTTDTSALVSSGGQANAGDIQIIVSSTAAFPASGWVLIGNQVVRYAGKTASSLTGIPASGDGSITASVPYGTVITVAPQLIGVTGIVWPILTGDPINVLAIVDDTNAQSVLAAKTGRSGIREGSLQDNRLSETEARARAQAWLRQRAYVFETFGHRSRDPLTKSGGMVTISIGPPTNLFGSWRIQDVTISTFFGNQPAPTHGHPTYNANSSSARFTFEDLVRQIKQNAETP